MDEPPTSIGAGRGATDFASTSMRPDAERDIARNRDPPSREATWSPVTSSWVEQLHSRAQRFVRERSAATRS